MDWIVNKDKNKYISYPTFKNKILNLLYMNEFICSIIYSDIRNNIFYQVFRINSDVPLFYSLLSIWETK